MLKDVVFERARAPRRFLLATCKGHLYEENCQFLSEHFKEHKGNDHIGKMAAIASVVNKA